MQTADHVRIVCALALSLATLLLPGAASAWTMYGRGSDTCEKFTETMRDTPLGQIAMLRGPNGNWYAEGVAYAQWIQGYVSALNALNSDGPREIQSSWIEMDRWIRDWCVSNPSRKLEDAVGSFVIEHVPKD